MITTEVYPNWLSSTISEVNTGARAQPQVSDLILAQKSADGNMEAFEELYRRHSRRVYSLCLRMTANVEKAEDLAQDVFVAPVPQDWEFSGPVGVYHMAAPRNGQSGLDALS